MAITNIANNEYRLKSIQDFLSCRSPTHVAVKGVGREICGFVLVVEKKMKEVIWYPC